MELIRYKPGLKYSINIRAIKSYFHSEQIIKSESGEYKIPKIAIEQNCFIMLISRLTNYIDKTLEIFWNEAEIRMQLKIINQYIEDQLKILKEMMPYRGQGKHKGSLKRRKLTMENNISILNFPYLEDTSIDAFQIKIAEI